MNVKPSKQIEFVKFYTSTITSSAVGSGHRYRATYLERHEADTVPLVLLFLLEVVEGHSISRRLGS